MNQSSRDHALLGVRPSLRPGRGAVSPQSSRDKRSKRSRPRSSVREEGRAISGLGCGGESVYRSVRTGGRSQIGGTILSPATRWSEYCRAEPSGSPRPPAQLPSSSPGHRRARRLRRPLPRPQSAAVGLPARPDRRVSHNRGPGRPGGRPPSSAVVPADEIQCRQPRGTDYAFAASLRGLSGFRG
jgi:hypothetical protein